MQSLQIAVLVEAHIIIDQIKFSRKEMASMVNGYAQLFLSTRLRDLIARGHTMPSDPKRAGGGCGVQLRASLTVFAEIGISVPISRGSPPLFIKG
ncbi:MAG TPA: hypothetical protein VFB60_23190 [Ktedonobacteraceae bacterium]|nr:hypothetical protein [Ktedonobacteraceae bacterium]